MTRELTLAELSDFTNAKVGDKVYSFLYGEVEITSIRGSQIFGIDTHLAVREFDYEGFENIFWENPTFFNRPVKIVAADTDSEK